MFIIYLTLLLCYCGLVYTSTITKKYSVAIFSYSLLSSITFFLFYTYNAADVALTEISVGVFLTFFFLYTVFSKTHKSITNHTELFIPAVIAGIACFGILCILLYTCFLLDDVSLQIQYANYYKYSSYNETGITNIITSILASYRGFDTLGEILIISLASFGVFSILKKNI